jgi:hypothetical protein
LGWLLNALIARIIQAPSTILIAMRLAALVARRPF